MSEEEDDICGYEKDDGEICEYSPKYSDGRCGYHSDEDGVGPGANEGEARNFQHGMYAGPTVYFKRLSDEDQGFIEAMYESFLADAPFDDSNVGKSELLWQVCIDLHKRRRANEYIDAEGMVQERVDGVEEGHGPIINVEENVLHIAHDRLGRTNTRILKELGILDDPDSQQAEAGETLIDLLSGDDDE